MTPSTTRPRRPFFSSRGCLLSFAVGGVSLVFYAIACLLPAMVFDKEVWVGLQVLLIGWQGFFLGQFAWFANPFWALGLLLAFFRRWLLTFAAGVLAFLIALDAFSFVSTKVPLDEAFVNTMIFQEYAPGFNFWLASLVWLVGAALVMWVLTRVRPIL